MRIVPTSWEVFPNALSAALQYASLDWPTENGWVNYNSLQQLSYFAVTFVAAPLAIVSGVRLSGVLAEGCRLARPAVPGRVGAEGPLPDDALLRGLHRDARRPRARTGALRNLNHMYAAAGPWNPEAFTGDRPDC